MVSTDHSDTASFCGALPVLARCAARIKSSAACLPAAHACGVGMREGSNPYKLRPVGYASGFFSGSPPYEVGVYCPDSAANKAGSSLPAPRACQYVRAVSICARSKPRQPAGILLLDDETLNQLEWRTFVARCSRR